VIQVPRSIGETPGRLTVPETLHLTSTDRLYAIYCDKKVAKDCRLESLNSNINKQFGQVQLEGFSISGIMSFQITLK
jgi:hypothetical protein